VLADVGLLGMPNAGKSTLITAFPTPAQDRRLSLHHCTPTWAWCVGPEKSFVVADIPGLIEGAPEAPAWGTSSCAICSAPGCCCMWWTWRPSTPGRSGAAGQGHRGRAQEVRRRAARQAALAGAEQAGHGARGRGAARVKDFVKRYKWKGPVFEISALTREGCQPLMHAIYDHVAAEQRAFLAEPDIRFDPP
jgi:GTP-binding protein